MLLQQQLQVIPLLRENNNNNGKMFPVWIFEECTEVSIVWEMTAMLFLCETPAVFCGLKNTIFHQLEGE